MATMIRNAGAALALAAALAGCGNGEAAEGGPAKRDESVVIGPENVYVAVRVEFSSGPSISGSLAAEREARVNAEAAGVVSGVFAEKGQAVRAGQVLARIDDSSRLACSPSAACPLPQPASATARASAAPAFIILLAITHPPR